MRIVQLLIEFLQLDTLSGAAYNSTLQVIMGFASDESILYCALTGCGIFHAVKG